MAEVYHRVEDFHEAIQKNPGNVEYVSVLPSGRCNVKTVGENSNFYCSLINDKGKQKYAQLIAYLNANKVQFSLLNKVENKKLDYKDGELRRTVAMKWGSEGLDVAKEDAPKEPEAKVAPKEPEAKVAPKLEDKTPCYTFDGLSLPITDLSALIESANPKPVIPDTATDEEKEALLEKHEKEILRQKAVAAAYIPSDCGYVPVPEIKLAMACVKSNLPVYFEGHTGTGKTEAIKFLAHKTQTPLLVLQGSEDMETSSLLGHIEIDEKGTFFVEGLVTLAVKSGWWLYIDEVNALPAGVKIALHGLLDDNKYIVLADNRGERIHAHENFRLFSAGNPVDAGLYAGIGQENLAFLNRFQRILLNYLPERVERNILGAMVKDVKLVDAAMIEKLVKTANMVRKLFIEGRVSGVVSTRDLKQTVANLSFLLLDECIVMQLGKFQASDRKAVLDCYEQHFGSLAKCRKLL